jgi:hypothetical protein
VLGSDLVIEHFPELDQFRVRVSQLEVVFHLLGRLVAVQHSVHEVLRICGVVFVIVVMSVLLRTVPMTVIVAMLGAMIVPVVMTMRINN